MGPLRDLAGRARLGRGRKTAPLGPWNRVKWQRFERAGERLELQIRRAANEEGWRVYVNARRDPG